MTNPQFGYAELAASQSQPEVLVNASDRFLSAAIAGQIIVNFPSNANLTLSSSVPPLITNQWLHRYIRMTDTGVLLTTGRDVIYPNVDSLYTGPSRMIHVFLNSTLQTLTFKRSGQTGVAVTAGSRALVFHNGTDIVTV